MVSTSEHGYIPQQKEKKRIDNKLFTVGEKSNYITIPLGLGAVGYGIATANLLFIKGGLTSVGVDTGQFIGFRALNEWQKEREAKKAEKKLAASGTFVNELKKTHFEQTHAVLRRRSYLLAQEFYTLAA